MEEKRQDDDGGNNTITGCYVRLSNKRTIFTMNLMSQDSQDWRRDGRNMEVGL